MASTVSGTLSTAAGSGALSITSRARAQKFFRFRLWRFEHQFVMHLQQHA
ncbi:MAG: hypothetical protein R3C16_03145 [Hyphomonadaceae bacterium]